MSTRSEVPHNGTPRWECGVGIIEGAYAQVPFSKGSNAGHTTVAKAMGIPYAYASRYQRPRHTGLLTGDLDGVFQATTPSPVCPQNPGSPASALVAPHAEKQDQDEDCQRLSITTPVGIPVRGGNGSGDGRGFSGLPVLVWIHGGGNLTGGGDAQRYAPDRFVAEHDVIVVNLTFRLGAFGFLGTDDLESAVDDSSTATRDGDAVANPVSPNLGLFDIRAALKWIRNHIDRFGGDPSNVTVIGQSAGADLAIAMMAAEGARIMGSSVAEKNAFVPLFHRVILHSAPIDFLEGFSVPTGGRGQSPRADMHDAMRAAAKLPSPDAPVSHMLDAEQRARTAALEFPYGHAMPFGPSYGHAPLPRAQDFEECLADVSPHIDVIAGCSPREASLFLNTDERLLKAKSLPVVGSRLAEAAIRRYSRITYSTRRFLTSYSRSGGRCYRFTIDWGSPANDYKSAHCVEQPLLWGNEQTWKDSIVLKGMSWEQAEVDGRALRNLWAGFARNGSLPADARAAASHFLRVDDVH